MKKEKIVKEEEVSEEDVITTKKVSKDIATVVWRLGTRTYTKAIHGDDFLNLAKQFVAKHGGVIE